MNALAQPVAREGRHAYMHADRWGEHRLDSHQLAIDLAPLLGAVFRKPSQEHDERGSLDIGDLSLLISPMWGVNKHRAEVYISAPALERKLIYRLIKWPKCSIDPGRPLASIAAEIKRKLIEPAAPLLEQVKAAVHQENGDHAALLKMKAEMEAQWPGVVSVSVEERKREAHLYINGSGVYFSGRLNADGSVYVDRVGSLNQGRVMRFLAALADPSNS